MISTLKRLKGNLRSGNKRIKSPAPAPEMEPVKIPENFVCPISLDLMRDPVILSSGMTYDRSSIDSWLHSGNYTCPATGLILLNFDLIPNHSLRKMIQDWCVVFGVDRVPTPRVPLQPNDAVLLLSDFTSAAEIGKLERCLLLLRKMRGIAAESQRNCRCLVDHGAGSALVTAFVSFSAAAAGAEDRDGIESDVVLFLAEALLALSQTLLLDSNACKLLAAAISSSSSASARRCIAWFFEHGDENSKKNAILTLRETILNCSHEQEREVLTSLMTVEGFANAIANLFTDPAIADSSSAKRASLGVLLRLVSGEETGPAILTGRQLVQSMLDLLIEDTNKGVTEAALGILDEISRREEGREEVYGVKALAVPVLVKKMLRVSEAATEMSVSTLWRLCCGVDGEAVMVEALEVGAFQKILVLLQIGCGEETKEKASEVLKMLNKNRGGFECIESADFKHLKRSFD